MVSLTRVSAGLVLVALLAGCGASTEESVEMDGETSAQRATSDALGAAWAGAHRATKRGSCERLVSYRDDDSAAAYFFGRVEADVPAGAFTAVDVLDFLPSACAQYVTDNPGITAGW